MVCDADPSLSQHWVGLSCLPGAGMTVDYFCSPVLPGAGNRDLVWLGCLYDHMTMCAEKINTR